jgi:hypothetical protein
MASAVIQGSCHLDSSINPREEVEPTMDDFVRKPIPATVVAVGIGIAAGKANANAAKAIGMPAVVFSGVLALVLMLFGFGA